MSAVPLIGQAPELFARMMESRQLSAMDAEALARALRVGRT